MELVAAGFAAINENPRKGVICSVIDTGGAS
jgi:hypothetical protein